MIQRISEEWDRVEDSFQRRGGEVAAGPTDEMLRAFREVREALRTMCQVSVTRTTLKSAVLEALQTILREKEEGSIPRQVLQEMDELRDRLESAARNPTGGLEAGIPVEVSAQLSRFEERVRRLTEFEAEVHSAFGEYGGRVERLESRVHEVEGAVHGVDDSIGSFSARLEDLDGRLGSIGQQFVEVDGRCDQLSRRLEAVQGSVGEVNYRVAEAEGLSSRNAGALDEVGRSLGEMVRSLEGRIAEWEGRLSEHLAQEPALRKDLEDRLRAEISGVGGSAQRFQRDLAALLERVQCSIKPSIERETGALEARLRDVVACAGKELHTELCDARDGLLAFTAELEERHDEEIGDLRGDVAGIKESTEGRVRAGLEALEGRLQGLGTELAALRDGVETFQSDFQKRRGSDLAEMRGEVAAMEKSTEARLRNGLGAVEGRLDSVRAELSGLISAFESSFPLTVDRKTEELEARLRKEIDDMVQNLADRLLDLREMVSHLETLLPPREVVESVDLRLGRIEERFVTVSAQVENIDSLTPEMRTVTDKLAALRSQIGDLSGDVGTAGQDLKGFHSVLAQGLTDLGALLQSGIQRWETDQSHMMERLSAIRDSLRDQLRAVGDRIETSSSGLLGRLTGKKEGDVRLSKEDWDHVSTKIEGIITGLESILSKKQRR